MVVSGNVSLELLKLLLIPALIELLYESFEAIITQPISSM